MITGQDMNQISIFTFVHSPDAVALQMRQRIDQLLALLERAPHRLSLQTYSIWQFSMSWLASIAEC